MNCCGCDKGDSQTQFKNDLPPAPQSQYQKESVDADPYEKQRKADEEVEQKRKKEREEEEERERKRKQEAEEDDRRKREADDQAKARAEKSNQFSCTIARNSGEAVGLDIDHIDGMAALVVTVKPGGAIQSWNESNRDKEIRAGDRIIEVNGSSGDVQQLIQKLKSDLTWKITVQRPIELHVSITKANAPTLGLDLKYAPNSQSLLITDIANGPMQDWNNEHPDKAVRANDRIVEINGARGKPQDLIQASDGATDNLEMVIAHYG